MIRRLTVMCLSVMLASSLSGCGNSSSGGSSDKAAMDTSKPLASTTKVSSKGQVIGTWMGVTQGPFRGMQFMSDGKALLTSRMGSAVTLKYDVPTTGQLSLIAPDGQTQVVDAKLAGDVLEISQSGNVERLVRVPEGKTLNEAIKELSQKLAAERKKHIEAIENTLSQSDLVLAYTGKAADNNPIVLKLVGTKFMTSGGSAVIDGDDPKVCNVQGHIQTASDNTAYLELTITQQQPPQGQAPYRATVTLKPSDDSDHPVLEGTLTHDGSKIPCKLTVDKAAHTKVEAHLAAIQKQMQDAIATVTTPLGAKAILSGTQADASQPKPLTVHVILKPDAHANPNTHSYVGTITSPNYRGVQQVNGRVAVARDKTDYKAVLLLNTNSRQNWVLTLDQGGFKGAWRPNGYASGQGTPQLVTLKIDKMWTADQLAARKAALDKYARTDLQTPHNYITMATFGNYPTPAWMQLQTAAGDKVTGRAYYPVLGGTTEFVGQIKESDEGPQIVLQPTQMKGEQRYREYAEQRWTLNVDDVDPVVKITGAGTAGAYRIDDMVLIPLDEQAAAGEQQKIADALSKTTFRVHSTRETQRSHDQGKDYAQFKFDPKSKQVTGFMGGTANFDGMRACAIVGQLAVDHDMAILTLEPQFQIGYKQGWKLVLYAHMTDKGLELVGPFGSPHMGGVISFTATSDKLDIPEKQRLLITALQNNAVRFVSPKKAGDSFVVIVKGGTRGFLSGTGPFFWNSNVGKAATYAGLLKPGEEGVIRVTYVNGPGSYPGGTANGVESKALARGRGLAYKVEKIPVL